ncbi:SDR family NAD(P)-dependent oxidoreductase [Neobacillus vireti]|uniref:SDR family NAD(P)-dependent oxidoreductase n=1 Tax=Neobacillus vireti TaxID=220686 RepID=UPI0030006900
MGKFNGKVVLVTGAAGGIGKALVKKVYQEGANVALVDLNEDALHLTAKELELEDSRYLTIAADVTKENQVKNYVHKTVEGFGRIDGFFNNAGVEGKTLPVEDYDLETFDFVFNVNVKGVFLGLKYVVPVMKKQGSGSIVNAGSQAGLVGTPGMSAYNSSKHAVLGLTKVVAAEVAGHGIRVNATAPGGVNTQMVKRIEKNTVPGAAEEAEKMFTSAIPMGRYGEPEEIANVAAFLLSDEASYVTASIYTIDGGVFPQ